MQKEEVNPTPTQQGEMLLPCLFCGDKLIEVAGNEWEEDFRATCIGCLAASGRYRTRAEAITAWNRRATVAGPREVAFAAYNQAIEDAKRAIREEHVANPCEAPTYINAIARRCSPHVYVNRLPAAASSATPAGKNDAPSDVDELLFRLAAKDCERLAAGGNDCTEELPFVDWCAVCQSRGLIQKYRKLTTTAPAERTREVFDAGFSAESTQVAGEQEAR